MRYTTTDLLYVDLNVFLQVVTVQVEYQIMDKVVAIAYNNQRQLVCQLCLLWDRTEYKVMCNNVCMLHIHTRSHAHRPTHTHAHAHTQQM